MHYHLLLTDDCNLACRYCRGRIDFTEGEDNGDLEIDWDLPADLSCDREELVRFLSRDPCPVLTFYGGEPLLRLDLISDIMARAPFCRFMIQTNGLLLDRVPEEIATRLSTILVSLDGPEALTDFNRGEGVYQRVVANLTRLRQMGYTGELIARMTVTEQTDIREAVHHLSVHCQHRFHSIHWQIDANFYPDYHLRDFRTWAESSYNPGIRVLSREWVDQMERTGHVPRWYPFLDPVEDWLLGRGPSPLRCGSGVTNFSILTDGHIVPCPIMVGMQEYYLGHIRDADPASLHPVLPGEPCTTCEIAYFCGGRCLYSNIVCPWPPGGRDVVCGTVRNLRESLLSELPRIRTLLDSGVIRPGDFSHEKYNGCEIIP